MTVEQLRTMPMFEEAERIRQLAMQPQQQVEDMAVATEQRVVDQLSTTAGMPLAHEAQSQGLSDTRVANTTPVISPLLLEKFIPVSQTSVAITGLTRLSAERILRGDDDRLIAIAGPCSLHDADAALEYAEHVKKWRVEYGKDLEIIMRAYPEKPRSEVDWKGLVYDPHLDGTYDINLGLVLTRLIATRITDKGVPIAMERLNATTPQYTDKLVAYDAIGARNTTDQKAREYASGSSAPVGFKNTPDGSVEDAVMGVRAANASHNFLGMSKSGLQIAVATAGNPYAHIILRGGKEGPNYSAEHIARAKGILQAKDVLQAIIVDASHGNSGKKAERQKDVVADLAYQVGSGETAIKGLMLESNLLGGAQKLKPGADLEYGVSVTDECLGLDDTAMLLDQWAEAARSRRALARAN